MGNNYWNIEKICNKPIFLANLIQMVPSGSIWRADGIEEPLILTFVKNHLTENYKKTWNEMMENEREHFEIELNDENKFLIAQEVLKWNLEKNIQDQVISFEGVNYLKSFDHLDESCTWISKKLNLEALKKEGIIQFERD